MDYGWVGADVFRGKVQVDSEKLFYRKLYFPNYRSLEKGKFSKKFSAVTGWITA